MATHATSSSKDIHKLDPFGLEEEECAPPPTRAVPASVVVHDQLPSAEELKVSLQSPHKRGIRQLLRGLNTTDSKRRRVILAAAALILVIILASILGTSLRRRGPYYGTDVTAENSRLNNIITYLVQANISDYNAFADSSSPQFQAAGFMAEDPLLAMLDSSNTMSYSTSPERPMVNFVQRYSTMVLFLALNGRYSQYSGLGWANARSECDWYAVNPITTDFSKNGCNANGELVNLTLSAYRLPGRIPTEIGHLTRLQILNLANNEIYGHLPAEMTRLTDLLQLYLQGNELSGHLDEFNWAALSNLQALYIGFNGFSGNIPFSILDLPQLTLVGLSDNGLEGTTDLFKNRGSKWQVLHMENNKISGPLDDSIIQNWGAMRELVLSGNNLASTIPASLFAHPNLNIVDLHKNEFWGIIPDIPANNSDLMLLSLGDNGLEGPIPTSIVNLADTLFHLDLSNNGLQSTIPNELGELTKLRYLDLSMNSNFEQGPIPSSLLDLTALQVLALQDCNRNGTIPTPLSNWTRLKLLDVSNNVLSGSIPSLTQVNQLRFAFFSHNNFTGDIGETMKNVPSAEIGMLTVDHNQLRGSLEEFCSKGPRPDFSIYVAACQVASPISSHIDCSCCSQCSSCYVENACPTDRWKDTAVTTWQNGYTDWRSVFNLNGTIYIFQEYNS